MAQRRSSCPAPLKGAVLGLCAALVMHCGGSQGPSSGGNEGLTHPMAGQKAPDFAAQDPSGPWLPLSSLKDKPVALLFFRPGASFAPDLAREFSRFRDDASYRPIVFLGIARESMERIKEFITIQRVTLPILRDPGPIASSYGIGDVPTVVLIDSDGIVRFRMEGYLGRMFQPRLVATMEALRRLPQFTSDKSRTARWDRFSRPDPLPEYGASAFPTVWWWDAEKAAKTGSSR